MKNDITKHLEKLRLDAELLKEEKTFSVGAYAFTETLSGIDAGLYRNVMFSAMHGGKELIFSNPSLRPDGSVRKRLFFRTGPYGKEDSREIELEKAPDVSSEMAMNIIGEIEAAWRKKEEAENKRMESEAILAEIQEREDSKLEKTL